MSATQISTEMLFSLPICVIMMWVMDMCRGNHWSPLQYHGQRVSEENRKPFGKPVGLGTLIIGIAMILFGILSFVFEQTQLKAFSVIGTVELIASILVGLAISFYAMKKYNGGIF